MLTVTKPQADRIEIDFNGGIDANIMAAALDELITLSEDITHGKMLYTIRDFEMPTLGAIGIEFTRLTKMFGLLSKFDRCAVLCDQGWIRTVAELEGAMLPGLEIKCFHLNEGPVADAWLNLDRS